MRSGASLQLSAVLADLGRFDEALACCIEVFESTRGYGLRGIMDLELWVTFIRSLRALGRREDAAAAVVRARALIEKRAAMITDVEVRSGFLTSKWVQVIEDR